MQVANCFEARLAAAEIVGRGTASWGDEERTDGDAQATEKLHLQYYRATGTSSRSCEVMIWRATSRPTARRTSNGSGNRAAASGSPDADNAHGRKWPSPPRSRQHPSATST